MLGSQKSGGTALQQGEWRESAERIAAVFRESGGGCLSPTDLPSSPAPASRPLVLVVDDDPSMREALAALCRSVGLDSELFGSTTALLQRKPPDAESCLILDVRLPGVSGLDFQAQVARLFREIPIIVMTGHGDIPMSVRAMKAGAVDFLAKPFRDQDMLDAVAAALARDRAHRSSLEAVTALHAHFKSLTAREREIMAHVTGGLMNKQIAARVGLSEITVKIHRGNLMKKMGARSLAELVRMAEALAAHPIEPTP
jgi:FixJ family two-component response regulator